MMKKTAHICFLICFLLVLFAVPFLILLRGSKATTSYYENRALAVAPGTVTV